MSRKLKKQETAPKQSQPKDNFQKPLTNEQKFSSLSYHIDQLYKVVGDVNFRLVALSRAKIDPKALTTFMRDTEANSNFMKNLNSELDLAAAKENAAQNEALKKFGAPDDNGPTMAGPGPVTEPATQA